ncbi:MOSC domain-containing protein [Luteolibacter sp. AS25]|uniref:MOSC domain-containing protein n=1 Tax=Luteolibacter sp. AS25 TaxID=3135776 RepID=UPI00398B51D6
MKIVGKIKEIWRYPVKGMAGERLESCYFGPEGLEGDRVWAVRDTVRQEIQSCKFRPELLGCTVRTRAGEGSAVDIEFPDGSILGSDSDLINERLTELVRNESTLECLDAAKDPAFLKRYKSGPRDWLEELKETFTREEDEPLPDFTEFPKQAQDFVTVPGSFFLVSPFHIITTATMKRMTGLLPGSDWDVRRFRPNIVIETYPGEEGLLEQEWIGSQLKIAGLPIDCTGTAVRCGAVTRAQKGIAKDTSMLRTIVKEAEQNLGIYGNILERGVVTVGDEVYLQK